MDTIRIISKEGRFVIRSTTSNIQILSYGKRGLPGEPGAGVATGGNAGQILSKRSAADYDTEWIDTPEGGVTSVNGRTGAVIGLAEKSELDMVESELSQNIQNGDAATLDAANSYTDSQIGSINYPVTSVNGETGAVVIDKTAVGLGNVDNTSDLNKPVSTAVQAALDGKANFPTSDGHIPIRNASGAQASFPYSNAPGASNVIPVTKTNGRLNAGAPVDATDATTKSYVDAADATKVGIANDETITGRKTFGLLPLLNSNPVAANHASNKGYIDGLVPIYGTGFPNGVVTATVGRIYIDTAVTNGASSWIKKSGTGNTGWQVLEGDTGWRNVTSSIINGWTIDSGGYIYVKRSASRVSIRVLGLNSSGATADTFLDLGSSFGTSTGGSYIGADTHTITAPTVVYRNTISIAGAYAVGRPGSAIAVRLSIDTDSTGAWPTTLPGTAA